MQASDAYGNLPALGYAGTSGHSGTDTSEERARTEDSDGTTSLRQRKILDMLQSAGRYGRTVKEVRDLTGLHHGKASSALSNLHKEGLITRLMDRRSKCRIYVLPDYVDGREAEPFGRKPPTAGHVYTLQEIKNGTGFDTNARFMQIDN